MQHRRMGDRIVVRFASGEQLVEPLVELLDAQAIGYAAINGIGAVSSATVSYWNAATKQYDQHRIEEQMEVVSLIGNMTLKDGQPFLHLHVALGRADLSVIGGHVNELNAHPALELWVSPEREQVVRELDPACGLFLMNLNLRP